MKIKDSIIHAIVKKVDTSGDDSTKIIPRNSILFIDDRVKKLADDVLRLYTRLSNGYGTLGKEDDLYPFTNYLDEYTNKSTSFKNFSEKVLKVIAKEMSVKTKTTTSYPIFFRYTSQNRDWLLIAMLKLKEGVGIDQKTLDLNDALTFDISDLREAARIDIAKWKSNTQPYLSFIKKGSGEDSGSSAYFRKALSCLEYTDAKFNTDNAIDAVNDYCEFKKFDVDTRQSIRQKMHDYFKENKDKDQPANLTSLSAIINDQEPDSFVHFVRENNYEVCETFSPNPQSFKKLRRLSKRFGSISLGFEVADLINEKVNYDKDLDSIVIRKPPQDLIDEIEMHKGGDESKPDHE